MMKFLGLAIFLGILTISVGTGGADDASSDVSEPASPAPGKQVLQTIDVPASLSVWSRPKDVDQLGEVKSPDPSQTETLSYWLFLPTDKSAKKRNGYPLLLFLHGAGERGSNPDVVKVHGPPKLVETEKGETWPFITVSPQCPADHSWSPGQLLILLDKIMADYDVDPSRVYVTGLSMGGYGTWMLLDVAGDLFAAAAPLCGGCSPEKADKMLDIPIWIFHGESDSVVPVDRSKVIEAAIRELGGKKVKMTIYPGVDHDCWTETYNNPELYKWFLKQRKKRGNR